jgi:osmotically inducible protein OsmC
MAFSNTLAEDGHAPESLEVTAKVVLDPEAEGGSAVTRSDLSVVGNVPGLTAEEFSQIAEKAEQGCPISNLLRGNATISVDARLAP